MTDNSSRTSSQKPTEAQAPQDQHAAQGAPDDAASDLWPDGELGYANPMTYATGFQSLTSGTQHRIYGNRGPQADSQNNRAAAIVGLTLAAVFLVLGIIFFLNRPVGLTVNGKHGYIRIGSTLGDAYAKLASDKPTKAGNYVSVSGKVLEEGKGYQFNVKLDGKDLKREEIDAYRIAGKEKIEFSDGGDRMEEYDVEEKKVAPKLTFEGDWGAVSFVKQWGRAGRRELRHGKQSGESADGDWLEEPKDCIVRTKNLEPSDDRKLVAITFDDGPADVYTEEYLRILSDSGARATFFNLSPNVENYPELARAIAGSDCQICSHTNNHKLLTSVEEEEFDYEISSAHDVIYDVSGVDTTIIRPPYGEFSHDCWLMTKGQVSCTVNWTQDSKDWELPGSDLIVENALTAIKPGSIILMHDGGGNRDQDFDAIPRIIDALLDQDYQVVTISELLASDPEVPDDIVKGSARLPEGAAWPDEIEGEDE